MENIDDDPYSDRSSSRIDAAWKEALDDDKMTMNHSTCTRNKGKTNNMFVCIVHLYFVSSALLSLRI